MTDEAIVFPDAVAVTVSYLRESLEDVGELAHVGSRVPDPRPARFVTVQRTGGPVHSLVVDGAQLTLEAWASSEEDAHDLAQLVRAFLHRMGGELVDGVAVYGVHEFAGPGLLPDPVSEQPRYTFTAQVNMRGTAYVASS
jgi:hypothetical protein